MLKVLRWDIVVIAFMLGGTALCMTSLVLAWRAVGRKLARSVGGVKYDARVGLPYPIP